MKECKCTLAQKTVGDGCSICNPKLMIEMLIEENKELNELSDRLISKVRSLIQYHDNKSCESCKFNLSFLCPIESFSEPALHFEKHPFSCNRYELKVQL